MRHLIPIFALFLMVTLLFGCEQAPVSMESEPQQTTEAPTTEAPTTEPSTTEPPRPVYAEPQTLTWSGLTYEDYFAEDKSWHTITEASHEGQSVLFTEDGIGLCNAIGKLVRKIPNMEDLAPSTHIAHSGFADEIFFVKDGILYMQNCDSGDRTVLYDQGDVAPYFEIACQEILYFAVQDQGMIKLCRLFLPENRLDILYEYESSLLLTSWLVHLKPETTLGNVVWRCVNPQFAPHFMKVLADPESQFINATPMVTEEIWTEDYFHTRPPFDYSVLYLCNVLENYYNIPYSIRGVYDLQTGEATINLESLSTDPAEMPYAQPQNDRWSGLTYDDYFAEDKPWEEISKYATVEVRIVLEKKGASISMGNTQRDLPNTHDLNPGGSIAYITHTDDIIFVLDGVLYLQNSYLGTREILYDAAEVAPNFQLVCHEILYFTVVDQDMVKLCRLFLPENRLDVLYEYKYKPVPISHILHYAPDTSLGDVMWLSFNPKFAPYLEEVLSDPESEFINPQQELTAEVWTQDYLNTTPPFNLLMLRLYFDMEKHYGIPFAIMGTYSPETRKANVETKDVRYYWDNTYSLSY